MVAIMIPNVPQFVIAYYGILSTEAAVVPLNVLLRGQEITYHLDDSDAKVLVVWEGKSPEQASRAPAEPASISSSSSAGRLRGGWRR